MYGKNIIKPPVSGDGLQLEVKNIFATLQGEGLYAGVPAVFIRLGGCNLACEFCDTDFDDAPNMLLAEVMARVMELAGGVIRLAVITGGEPLRQNIFPLCESLLAEGLAVQVETNGTLYRPLPEDVDIVCSPKNTGAGYAPLRPDLLEKVSALKYLISAGNAAYNHVPEIFPSSLRGGIADEAIKSRGKTEELIAAPSARNDKKYIPIFVQPMDEGDEAKNIANRKLAVELCMQKGYRLSMQLHKILGIE